MGEASVRRWGGNLQVSTPPSDRRPTFQSSLSSEISPRPPRSLFTRDVTDSPPRIYPRPRYLPTEVSSPHMVPQEEPTMLPGRLSRSTRPSSPQPPRPRFLSPQQSNVDSPRLAQIVSPPPSMKCPVCLEPFQSIRSRGSNLVSTVCGHVFCGKCLPACVRINGNCPTCRKIIGYEDFHPLYLF